MDLRQLEIVVAVAEEGGFTAAAHRLHTVQSTVSTVVRALERDLGTSLFERTTHRVALTPAGRAFLPAARAALKAAEHARATVDSARWKLGGRVRIGVMPGAWPDPHRALAALRREHPGVQVQVRMAPPRQLLAALRESAVDALVAVENCVVAEGLVARPLRREAMLFVSGSDDRAADRPITAADAATAAVVDFAPGWANREATDRAFQTAQVRRVVAHEVTDAAAAAELVRHDLGACILPASVAARFPDLTSRPFTRGGPTWHICVTRPAGDPAPALAAVLRHLT
ncbi:LysR family transcriptional regulator [Amycolatopsis sp. FDAARGOS 1241]|uniref:LysR family transcriptional regulator n=1 Tax=Amycolatopsis sp. FDAARGOS 1241 TaxID=2778070 RepID=UPI001951DA26|nr:LysR family transcriptional regulator [Amycolatopsis sp. FDAARGOS 1241]QRP49851.1 LysR family transcriptional regulator [Amycolatopsis sp. FDAARGOS 1241]